MNGDFGIDFENNIGKLEFRPATAEKIAKYQSLLKKIPEAEWPIHLGEIVVVGKARKFRPKTEALEQAVKVLVECRDTPFHEVALKCARAVGKIYFRDGDPISVWQDNAHKLRQMFAGKKELLWHRPKAEVQWPHPWAQEIGELGIYLVPGPDGKPRLSLKPRDLQDALTLCAARMIATGTTFATCLNCKSPFLRGGQSERRGDAVFCNSRCKSEYHNKQRRKAKSK
jgi:hypothetical protein